MRRIKLAIGLITIFIFFSFLYYLNADFSENNKPLGCDFISPLIQIESETQGLYSNQFAKITFYSTAYYGSQGTLEKISPPENLTVMFSELIEVECPETQTFEESKCYNIKKSKLCEVSNGN
jgi:hypothetical protein